jgi:hypothetical protein
MFRKLALAAVGALTIGAGVAAAPAPAAAQVGFYFGGGGHHGWHGHHSRPHFGFGFYPRYRHYPRYRYYDDYYPRRHCERVVVRKKIRGDWRRVVERRCYRPRRDYW